MPDEWSYYRKKPLFIDFFIVKLSPRHTERIKVRGIQELLMRPKEKLFDERIIRWLANPAEIQCNLVKVGPKVQHSSYELRTIIYTNIIRYFSFHDNLFKHIHHLVCKEPPTKTAIDSRVKTSRIVRILTHYLFARMSLI